MKIAIALAAVLALLLLFGCAGGVPQGKYDELKASCDSDKAFAAQELASEKSKGSDCRTQLADCNNAKKAVENVLAAKNAECAPLVNAAGLLRDARIKTAAIEKYRNATSLYDDTYGPGKIANTAKLNRIESHVLSLNDPPLYARWRAVRTCGSISECDNAKSQFLSSINQTISGIALEVADIVK
jgi:hypothetical protein